MKSAHHHAQDGTTPSGSNVTPAANASHSVSPAQVEGRPISSCPPKPQYVRSLLSHPPATRRPHDTQRHHPATDSASRTMSIARLASSMSTDVV